MIPTHKKSHLLKNSTLTLSEKAILNKTIHLDVILANLFQMFSMFKIVDFKKLVLNSYFSAIVDFYANWCGPCKLPSSKTGKP